MKRKYINTVLACGMAFSLAACADVWDEHYQTNPALNGSESLWTLISEDPELDDFEALLVATGYDELLSQERSYTVWAPADLSEIVDVKSLNTASDSLLEVYRREIVENHIADYSQVAGGNRDKEDKKNYKRVVVLNGKSYHFEGKVGSTYSFASQQLKTSNIVATNGVLHKLDKGVQFSANIWEQMAKESSISSLYNFLNKDTKREFNANSSVLGPIVDGKQTYLDSVFKVSNRWIDNAWYNGGIGGLNVEDSTYTMYALTNTAWEEFYTKLRSYYNYPEINAKPELGGEPLQVIADSIVREMLCENLVFSNTVNKRYTQGDTDTLISTRRNYFIGSEADSLDFGCVKKLELSNGELHIIDHVNFNPFTCWHDTIRVEGESITDGDGENVETLMNYSLGAYVTTENVERGDLLYGKVSGRGVTVFEAKPKFYPNIHFYPKDVLSAHYRISIVMVPPHLLASEGEEVATPKKNRFNATLYINSADGKEHIWPDIRTGVEYHHEKVDTIVLWENVKIDFSEARYKEFTGKESLVRVRIETPQNNNTRSYSNTYRIDQVMFEPINPED